MKKTLAKRGSSFQMLAKRGSHFKKLIIMLAVAALATFANTRTVAQPTGTSKTVKQEQQGNAYGNYTRYNGTTMRFVN